MSGERLTGLERRGLADVLRIGATGDPTVLLIAAGQHGVIGRRQALAVDLSEDQIDHRLARCSWTRAHQGVYLLGPPGLIEWQPEMAAVLAVGKATLLGAASALAAYGLAKKPKRGPTVLAMARDPRPRDGIDILRAPLLDHRDTRWFKGIPIVSPVLALLDSAPGLTRRELAQAVATGYRRNVVRRAELEGVLERLPGRRGAAAIRELLASETEPVFTRSQLEEMGLALVRRAGFPPPRRQPSPRRVRSRSHLAGPEVHPRAGRPPLPLPPLRPRTRLRTRRLPPARRLPRLPGNRAPGAGRSREDHLPNRPWAHRGRP